MRLRTTLAALAIAAAGLFAAPAAQAQVALGSGFSVTGSLAYASDYLFRGISQTGSRMAGQGTAELSHESGFYIGAFVSNVYFPPAGAFPQRAEIDGLAGFRFQAAGFNFDVGGVWYTYHEQRGGFARLNFAEGIIKATREFGPVTANATLAFSPNFFGSSGFGAYLEGGADWNTGIWGLTASGRIGYQWIERNTVFGTPDYANWSIAISRTFDIGFGSLVAAVGYYDTSISRSRCIGGFNVCQARALGSITWKF
jgi:uncharacterized protein (TIGR02001 family)